MEKKACSKCRSVKFATSEFFALDKRHATGLSPQCRACCNASTRAWRAANPESVRTASRAWAKANTEAVNAYSRAWAKANKESARAKNQAWRNANRETVREYSRAWAKANPAKCAAISKKRKAAKLNAVPPWYDEKKVQAIYAKAAAKTKATGILHHCDHIIPLQSPLVCGLHYHKNLRVVTAEKNMLKGNRTWPGMP